MKYLLSIILFAMTMNTQLLFDFNRDSNIQGWRFVDDGVMGGRSNGSFGLTPEGCGLFEGQISLENNGGFSSVRHRFEKMRVEKDSKIVVRLKGDGKTYQLRVKDDADKEYSYITSFPTSGEWEEVIIPLASMYPSFRGRKLDRPNFAHSQVEVLVFLIGNGKAESFRLLIDKIELK